MPAVNSPGTVLMLLKFDKQWMGYIEGVQVELPDAQAAFLVSREFAHEIAPPKETSPAEIQFHDFDSLMKQASTSEPQKSTSQPIAAKADKMIRNSVATLKERGR